MNNNQMFDQDIARDLESTTTQLRRRYGVLIFYANRVSFKSGASYSIPGVNDANGNPFVFKGKQPGGNQTHIVLVLTCETREGVPYDIIKDVMRNDAKQGEPWLKIVQPSFIKFLGQSFSQSIGRPLEVCVEEVPYATYQGTNRESGMPEEKQKTIWRIVELYASRDERKAAEAKYFAAFTLEKNNGELPVNALPDAETMQMLESIWGVISQGENADAEFINQVSGTPEMAGYNPALVLDEIKRVEKARAEGNAF